MTNSTATSTSSDGTTTTSNLTAQLQAGATAALATTKEYLVAAQETAQPHIARAKEAASNYISGDTQTGVSTDTSASSSTGVPVTEKLQAGASAALSTTKEYLVAAHETAQPHIARAAEVASSYMSGDNTHTTAPTSAPASSTGIPATDSRV